MYILSVVEYYSKSRNIFLKHLRRAQGGPTWDASRPNLVAEGKGLNTGLDELYKRWFDNMKDYLEKKKKRQQQNNPGGKKVKV